MPMLDAQQISGKRVGIKHVLQVLVAPLTGRLKAGVAPLPAGLRREDKI